MPKVLVGMSGGVDSSVTASLLLRQGYEVEGLSLILWGAENRQHNTACCSHEAMESASATADKLGVAHRVLDARGTFLDAVIGPFVEAYVKGLTPNPCILCNRFVKFPFLLREAEKCGAAFIATGHYARVTKKQSAVSSRQSADSTCFLRKGVDPRKDQSYVLYMLGQETLQRLLLPLGGYLKDEVRTMARELNLAAADRQESQEICFIGDTDYCAFIKQVAPLAGGPGPILDGRGRTVGTHRGIYCYTIGQRKGLGISSPEPYYVRKIDAVKNAVHVGPQDEAKGRSFIAEDMHWILEPGERDFRASVKVRSMMEARPASVEVRNTTVLVTFDEPQWAPAPGQSAVLYREDVVLGGGTICDETHVIS